MIINYDYLHKIRDNNLDKKISIIKGSWDLFHYDHLQILKNIKNSVDILVVEVKSDIDVSLKGKNRPIIPEDERVEIVDSIKYVDYTILANKVIKTDLIDDIINDNHLNSIETYKFIRDGYIIEKLRPDIIYHIPNKEAPIAIRMLCKRLNIVILPIPHTHYRHHTSDIIDKCISSR